MSDLTVVVKFNDVVINVGSGGSITIRNSDNSFSVVASSSPFVVPDNVFNFVVNGVTTSQSAPALVNHTFNISI